MTISEYNKAIINIIGSIFIGFGAIKIVFGLKSTWLCLKYLFYPSASITFSEIIKFSGITLFLTAVLPICAIYSGVGLLKREKWGWICSVLICMIIFIVSSIGTITFIIASYHFRDIPMMPITEGSVVKTYSMIPTYIQCVASLVIGIILTRNFLKEPFFIDGLKYNKSVEQTARK